MKTEHEYNDILSMVTHDLKSPLTALMCSLEYLSFDDLTKKEKDESINIARKASKNILKLVESILVMAKYEAGKEHLELANVENLQSYFIDMVKTFKYEMRVKNIKFNGIGIPKDKRAKVFEKYDTHNNKKVFKGTGLGLYNAHNFVKKHQGSIEIIDGLKSRGIGFKITIPVNSN
ncbi:MAG: hypothetical protein GQ570_14685 [Helicobacteraceae bacterium]|nr:hypothetical protein [Helicobacteraceae bacterium]